jgi:hypothetical protein
MIIVRLDGGLGNQLFQYAAGRRLAYRHKTELKLDITTFHTGHSNRKYELFHYNISGVVAPASDVARFVNRSPGFFYGAVEQCRAALHLSKKGLIRESHFHFDPEVLALPDNLYMWGYWQSERYFEDIRPIILKEFTLCKPAAGQNADLLEEIGTTNAVGLHVRRADYARNPHVHNVHGTCDREYYEEAISRVLRAVQTPHFYIFSDEPEWARANLRLEHPATYVSHNGPDDAVEDLRLMSACQHFIIANSSFSWWAAWLSQNQARLVCAPSRWFNDRSLDTRDLLPQAWQRI